MYKIEVLSKGKYNNAELGARYTFFKRKAIDFIKFLKEEECDFEVTKFTRLHFGFYAWSRYHAYEKLEKYL